MFSTRMRSASLSLLAAAGLALGGCGGAGAKGPEANTAATPAADEPAPWPDWCTEHGVPEEHLHSATPRSRPSSSRKGDWCKEHNRPESQCFLCNPKLEAKFAAEYEAKYGKKPPKSEGDKS